MCVWGGGGGGVSVGVCVCVEGVVCVWVVRSVQSSIAHVMNVLLMYSK